MCALSAALVGFATPASHADATCIHSSRQLEGSFLYSCANTSQRRTYLGLDRRLTEHESAACPAFAAVELVSELEEAEWHARVEGSCRLRRAARGGRN